MSVHACLFLAHQSSALIKKNIELLDDEAIDFFIHLDNQQVAEDFQALISQPRFSKVYLIPAQKVNWGGYSFIEAELRLYRAAFEQGGYQYFHLLSESDLLLVSKEYLLNFFEQQPANYLEVRKLTKKEQVRARHYYPLQDIAFLSRNQFGWGLAKLLIYGQKIVGIRRPQRLPVFKGSNWCSLRRSFVQYLLSENTRKLIEAQFKRGSCYDELYKQSLFLAWLADSSEEVWVNDSLRYIDWREQKASPKYLEAKDFSDIEQSNKLFCRKVSPDSNLIPLILEGIGNEKTTDFF